MMDGIIWTLSKVQSYLMELSPYRDEFVELIDPDYIYLIYKQFIICIVAQNEMSLGIQPNMDKEKAEYLKTSLERIVDKVNIIWL